MNKKSESGDLMWENVGYPILILIVFAGLFLSFNLLSGYTSFVEQKTAKQIALTLDKARPGTEININLVELFNKAEKNKFEGNVISIDNDKKIVSVRSNVGKGYEFYFFSDDKIVWNLDKGNKQLVLKIG